MYLTEYWNDDDDDEDVLYTLPPSTTEQLKVVIEFEQDKNSEKNLTDEKKRDAI